MFGHDGSSCPKRPKVVPKVVNDFDADGFQEVKGKGKKPVVFKPNKPKLVYKPVVKKHDDKAKETSKPFVQNSFDVFSDYGKSIDEPGIREVGGSSSMGPVEADDSDNDEVLIMDNETAGFMASKIPNKGASTPSMMVPSV